MGNGLRRIFYEAENQKLRLPELMEAGTKFWLIVYLAAPIINRKVEF